MRELTMPSNPKIEYGAEDIAELIADDIKRRYGVEPEEIEKDLGCEDRWFAGLPRQAITPPTTEDNKETQA
jgi:hypothetical protein